MLREGSGKVRPRPATVTLSPAELRWLSRVASERERRRGYARAYTTWKRGLIVQPTFVGLVGEYALCQFLNQRRGLSLSVNVADAPGGDGGVDLTVFRVPVQVKTRTSRYDVLIRRCAEDGRLLPLNWQACVSVTWERREGEPDPAAVTLDGWTRKSALLDNAAYVPGRRGPWKNLELCDEDLESMEDFLLFLDVHRDLGGLR